MTGKILNMMKNGHILVPQILINNYKKLEITDQELILLIYLIGNTEFDPERISKDLGLNVKDTLKLIDNLSKKDILKINMKSGKVCEEYINLDEMYNKLVLFIINDKKEVPKTNIYDKFEKEFGRTLSPMEYEIIGAWLEGGTTEELIELALKEAIYNGVSNLRYIDKILSEWQKKGIKTANDIQKEHDKHIKTKPQKEVFDYDWLNEKD
jgi:DNA replication protein